MMHGKSDSDITSLAASSPPRSPKRGAGAGGGAYYVQSPSRDSAHDGGGAGGYKSSSMQATPVYNSPNESPSHPSYGRHSRASSVSRFSGILRGGSGRKGGGDLKAVNAKGWPECSVIEEEGSYEGLSGGDSGLSGRCKLALAFVSFLLLFTVVCLIVWGAARPYEPDVVVKSIAMDNFYAGEGTDHSGVPTKMVTLNCSLNMVVYNPASMFGIHVSSGPVRLLYSEIAIGVGQVHKYYQPSKSHRLVSAVIHGEKVPLYGAGGGLLLSGNDVTVPLTVDFELVSRGYVIGKLVRVTHKVHVTCRIAVDAKRARTRIPKKACAVYKA
ncbi:uncharacterized protein [Aegilops tauschii subsp. strangulata]|uniref:Late embryogenesis abundant protein LEA-2 subgroup domain-containing protein n=2 Tax=Aegilops tauschii TaxID=37682 RepID=A0A453QT49_AEGTS|nr:uncharacterized protein LOC109739090 [Aegilops tauschii subsp. strangulata]